MERGTLLLPPARPLLLFSLVPSSLNPSPLHPAHPIGIGIGIVNRHCLQTARLFSNGYSCCCLCVWLGLAAPDLPFGSSPLWSLYTRFFLPPGCFLSEQITTPTGWLRSLAYQGFHSYSRLAATHLPRQFGSLLSAYQVLQMANTKISLLSQLHDHDKSMSWNAEVLVSRIWHYRGGTDFGTIKHTDIVVLDQEGTHMYGQLPPEPAERLKDVLEEGKVYLMKKFMCNQSKQTYRAVESPYMMQFTRFSAAVPKPGIEEAYPYCTYNLIPFSDIPVQSAQTPRFLDVIGRITAVTDIVAVHSQHQPEPSDTRTIALQDQSGNEMIIVLWGARAREFEADEIRATSEGGAAVIGIFVGTLPKVYKGVKGLSGSSACRWYIDEDLPEINAFRASLQEGLPPVTAQIPGELPLVPAPVREAPVEMSVKELLALDPFDNLKKQFMVKVVITRLGSDNRWWFLSCRRCHKTAYTSGRNYRCSDRTCPSVCADASYCVCTFGSDDTAEAEFMFFDRAARSLLGKPLMNLIHQKYPGFTEICDLAQIGDGDVIMPVEITRTVTQQYSLVVSISNKSFQPTSTQLSFQVSRIDQTFKPTLAPLGFGDPSHAPEASPSSDGLVVTSLIPSSFPMGSTTLVVLPTDEMHTPLSTFKGKGHALVPKTPSKSPCPKTARRKVFASPSKTKEPASTADVTAQLKEIASAEDVVQPTAVPQAVQETHPAADEDEKTAPSEQTKPKRGQAAPKESTTAKKSKQ